MTVELTTFGFKSGAPIAGDLMLDVRVLPNPFYEPELKPLTGCDRAIADFFAARPEVAQTIEQHIETVRKTVEEARREGSPQVRIAVGCTGGQHRSVYVAERIADSLRAEGIAVRIVHRELVEG